MDKLLVLISKKPYLSIDAQENFDVILAASAFSQCSVLFLGEGLLQLLPGQRTTDSKVKVFTRGYAALPDYGIDKYYCESTDMEKWSLDSKQLIIEPIALSPSETDKLIRSFDKVLNL